MTDISIIIPFYNCENYIERCIQSAIRQTYKNIEIIIINDGSTDNSKNIVQNINDTRIKYYEQNHYGVSSARNKGIQEAQGKYILFLDADDWLEENACELLVQYINNGNKTNILFFNFRYWKNIESKVFNYDNSYQYNILRKKPIFFDNVKNNVLLLNYVVWNKLYDIDFIKENHVVFNTKYNFSEDMLFCIELFSKNPQIFLIDDVLYNYQIHKNGTSRISQDKMFDTLFNMYEYVVQQPYYQNNLKCFIDNIFLKMCIYIYKFFRNTINKTILYENIKQVLCIIRKQHNINILNSFRYRYLLSVIFYNNLQEILKRIFCIF